MSGGLTYANVVSTLCLLLGGGAYTATHLKKNSVARPTPTDHGLLRAGPGPRWAGYLSSASGEIP